MHFRVVYSIKDLFFARSEYNPIEFNYGGDRSIKVIIRAPDENEKTVGHKSLFCECYVEFTPSSDIDSMFHDLYNNKLPSGSKIDERHTYIEPNGVIESNHIVPLSFLPSKFQLFHSSLSSDLNNYCKRTIEILRWLEDLPGPHNPFAFVKYEWSFDSKEWNSFPHSIQFDVESPNGIITNKEYINLVTSFFNSKISEPFCHKLFREAWGQRHTNPRSSLVIGITAAESSVKSCISLLQPETKWLVENMPSPNLDKLLNEYIPKLPFTNRINNKIVFPNDTVLQPLKKGVSIRNIIVHGGEVSLDSAKVKEILISVKDLLLLIDYYNGYSFSINHISKATKNNLKLTSA